MNTTHTAPTATEIDDMVRSAYRGLATGDRYWVGLADLRARLANLTRADQDASLKRLARPNADGVREANLVPESNQKALTDEDRAAALTMGGEQKHLICLGR